MTDTDGKRTAEPGREDGGAAALFPGTFDMTAVQVRAKVLQDFTADVNRIAADAVASHAGAVSAAQERLAGVVRDLATARRAPELIAAQARLIQSVVEGAAEHAAIWSEQARKLSACCAELARDSAATGDGEARSRASTARRSDKRPADRRSADE